MEEVGPKEKFQQFYPADFEPIVAEVYQTIGSPELSLLTAWSIFTKISDIIESGSLY